MQEKIARLTHGLKPVGLRLAFGQKTRVCESSKDPDGHPCVGYMDGDEFVPNKETLEAFSERTHILSEYYADGES